MIVTVQMRNVFLAALSLLLFAVVGSQSSTAFAQRPTCALELKVIDANKAETDELNLITGARAIATKSGSRRTIPAVMVEGQPMFPELTDGDYKIIITKRGFKRTVQQISFMCLTPSRDTQIDVKLEPGSSKLTVTNEKQTVKAGVVYGAKVYGIPDTGGPISSGSPVGPGSIDDAPPPPPVPPSPARQVISGGVLNGKAISLPKPPYPAIARTAGASGTVIVQVTIDEEGNVISASAVSGPPLLRAAAVQAARAAKFAPTKLSGQPVKVTGVINYNFTLPPRPEPKATTD